MSAPGPFSLLHFLRAYWRTRWLQRKLKTRADIAAWQARRQQCQFGGIAAPHALHEAAVRGNGRCGRLQVGVDAGKGTGTHGEDRGLC